MLHSIKCAVVGTIFIALQAWHMAQTGAFIDGRLNVYTHRLKPLKNNGKK